MVCSIEQFFLRHFGNFNLEMRSVCYLFCLNRKLPDLPSSNKFVIAISVLFSLNFNIQSTGFGVTFLLDSVLKQCGI